MLSNLRHFGNRVVTAAKSTAAKVGTGLATMGAAGLAAAQATSPGGAIAAELAGGKADVLLIIAAVAVILGALIVWGYVKRAR